MSYDIAVIGAGVAGCFAALKLSEKHKNVKTIVFELGRPFQKRRRQLEGALGCFPNSDGKIYLNDLEKISNIVDGRRAKAAHKWVFDQFGRVNPMKIIKDNSPNNAIKKRIAENNFEITLNDYIQWKPESVHQLSRLIAEDIESAGNVEFNFDNEVHKIYKNKNTFHIVTSNGEFTAKKVILCIGRSGWRWATKIYKELGLAVNDDYATFGVRLELPSQNLKELNKSHCTLTKDKFEVGPFSWNGTVIPEDHADLVISSFRSNEDRWKTDKVSFSLLASRYFKDQGCYQTDRLGKLAFLLFNDRINKERIKYFMKKASQLCFLPEYDWLKESLEELDGIFPNLINRGYMHAPNVLPLASSVRLGTNLESEIDGLFIAGESAGVRGIAAAAMMGVVAAESACK